MLSFSHFSRSFPISISISLPLLGFFPPLMFIRTWALLLVCSLCENIPKNMRAWVIKKIPSTISHLVKKLTHTFATFFGDFCHFVGSPRSFLVPHHCTGFSISSRFQILFYSSSFVHIVNIASSNRLKVLYSHYEVVQTKSRFGRRQKSES